MSAQVTITQLPAAGAITGTEAVPIVQNGQTVQTTTAALAGSPIQTQTFLTKNQEPTLPNSRALSGGTGVGLVDGGAQSTLQVTLNGVSGSLETASNGIIAKSGGSVTGRTLSTSGSGLSVTDGNGVSGNPTFQLTGVAASVANLSGTGMLALTGGGTTVAGRELTGTANQISVTNGTGASGAPTFAIANNAVFPGTESVQVPAGTTAQRPAVPVNGDIRYNTDTSRFEIYAGSSWTTIGAGDGTVTSVSGTANQISVANGTTTPQISITSNPVLPGTGSVSVPAGGTAARPGSPTNGMMRYNTDISLFEGYLNGAWTSFASAGVGVLSINTGTGLTGGPITSTGTISLANTAVTAGSYTAANITVNAQGQVTAASSTTGLVSSFSAGTTGLTPASATGGAVTLAGVLNPANGGTGANTLTGYVKGTGVTAMTASATVPTSDLSGTVTNGQLSNSSLTVGTTNIALGATSLTLGGLTSVAVTQDPTTNFQVATKQYVDGLVTQGISYHTPVYLESPNTTGNLNATYANGGTNINIIDIANGSDLTFFGAPPAVGDQLLTSTGNGLVAGTQYWVVAEVGVARQISLTYGGAPITGLTNGGVTLPSRYNDGVGATLTNAGTQAALTIDGVLTTVGMRVLIYNQTNAIQNGVYTVTTVGTVSTNWVLTRAIDADTYGLRDPNALGFNDAFFVQAGASGAGETYVCTTTGSIFFGLTNISFAQISSAQVYTAGNGLTLTGTEFALTAPVTAPNGGTGQTSYATGDLLYASNSTTLSKRAIGTEGYALRVASGVPSWQLLSTGFPVLLHSGATSVDVSILNGSFPVLLHNGVTSVNVTCF
jgi:hypothetical protein